MFGFDPLNPYATLDPYARLSAPPRQPSPVQPLAPQEEESVLGRIGSAALGGVGYAGAALEKALGGRALRGALGGKPRELLSIIPFSDTLGITNEADRVSGKELLGYDRHDDSWGGMLGGMGGEMALDPGSYLTFGAGALSKAGQAAKAAGVLPKTTAARATGTLADILRTQPAAQGAGSGRRRSRQAPAAAGSPAGRGGRYRPSLRSAELPARDRSGRGRLHAGPGNRGEDSRLGCQGRPTPGPAVRPRRRPRGQGPGRRRPVRRRLVRSAGDGRHQPPRPGSGQEATRRDPAPSWSLLASGP